jgi:hypothetical protein
VYVLSGDAKARLCADVLAAYEDPERDAKYREEYPYYPREWVDPYLARRRKVGWDLYSLLEISREDKARMHEQHARNFRFFDALSADLHDRSHHGAGKLARLRHVPAKHHGGGARAWPDTCPAGGLHAISQDHWAAPTLPEEEMVVCGMSLGYADPRPRPIN